VPSERLEADSLSLAKALDAELSRGLDIFQKKQTRLDGAENCMARYVQAPMSTKADELSRWSELVMEHLESIPEGAGSVAVRVDGTMVVLQFDLSKYSSPREEAVEAARMAQKLYRQQQKVDRLRHQNEGTEAALAGWRKRVRLAAARGEAAAMEVLRNKLLDSSKKLGLRRSVLARQPRSEQPHEDVGI